MTALSNLWTAILDDMRSVMPELGVESVEKAEHGKTITLSPGIGLWIRTSTPNLIPVGGKPITMPVDVFFFCASAPTSVSVDAVDAALEIAVNVFKRYAGRTISSWYLSCPEKEPPIEILESFSNAAVVGVTLTTEVTL